MHKKSEKHFDDVSIFGIPVGKFVSKRSFLAQDAVTLSGVREAQEIIQKKEEGLSVYFAHLGLLDIFGTAVVMESFADFKAIFPVAGSWYYFPALRPIFKQLVKQVPHVFIPVFRKEEFGRQDKVSVFDFSKMSEAEMKNANQLYAQKANQALKNGDVVMLAPYGGRAPIQEHLRSGSVQLLQSGVPVIFTLTKWNWNKMEYKVFFSKVYRFNSSMSREQAHSIIYDEYVRMAKLGRISRKAMLESKKPTVLSKSILIILSTLFSGYLLSATHSSKRSSSHKSK